MSKHPPQKYHPFAPIDLHDCRPPNARLTKSPIWLTTDLREGNQALIKPLHVVSALARANGLAVTRDAQILLA